MSLLINVQISQLSYNVRDRDTFRLQFESFSMQVMQQKESQISPLQTINKTLRDHCQEI